MQLMRLKRLGMKHSKQDQHWLDVACKIAETSTCKQRHAAIIVSAGRVLGVAVNIQKNDPAVVNWNSAHIHAEIGAMRRARWPKRATVYVGRIDAKGAPALSKPCIRCQAVIDAHQYSVVHT